MLTQTNTSVYFEITQDQLKEILKKHFAPQIASQMNAVPTDASIYYKNLTKSGYFTPETRLEFIAQNTVEHTSEN